jgi:RNA polymerase sigma factor (TIGR02999 family)
MRLRLNGQRVAIATISGTDDAMPEPSVSKIARAGDAGVAARHARWFARFYEELHGLACRQLRRNKAITLTPTTLLHESYLSICQREAVSFANGERFLAYVARAMRGLVIDHMRRRGARKRGGDVIITSLATGQALAPDEVASLAQMERLSTALESLAQVDERLAECVDLKFFCGLSFAEIARMKRVSERTVQRDWDKARMILNRFIIDSPEPLPEAP